MTCAAAESKLKLWTGLHTSWSVVARIALQSQQLKKKVIQLKRYKKVAWQRKER
jgi:hypothetical protein